MSTRAEQGVAGGMVPWPAGRLTRPGSAILVAVSKPAPSDQRPAGTPVLCPRRESCWTSWWTNFGATQPCRDPAVERRPTRYTSKFRVVRPSVVKKPDPWPRGKPAVPTPPVDPRSIRAPPRGVRSTRSASRLPSPDRRGSLAALMVFFYQFVPLFDPRSRCSATTRLPRAIPAIAGGGNAGARAGLRSSSVLQRVRCLTWSARERGPRQRAFLGRPVRKNLTPNTLVAWLLADAVCFAGAATPGLAGRAETCSCSRSWLPRLLHHFSVDPPSWSLGAEAVFYASVSAVCCTGSSGSTWQRLEVLDRRRDRRQSFATPLVVYALLAIDANVARATTGRLAAAILAGLHRGRRCGPAGTSRWAVLIARAVVDRAVAATIGLVCPGSGAVGLLTC